jgi:hypothetical protein
MEKLETMTQDYFERGFDIETYLEETRSYRSLVRRLNREAEVGANHVEDLKKALSSHSGPVLATVVTESWCGDSACNLPLLRRLFAEAEVPFRVFDREHHPELKELYLAEGEKHIPVVSLWDGEGREIGRWIEAPAAVQPLKKKWKKEHPRMMELYGKKARDREAEKEFARLYRDFLEDMAVWYIEGMWNETAKEIAALAEKSK